MPIYYTDKELDRMLGVDFHREIKPFILKDARKLGYLQNFPSTNPDIGLEDKIIYLRDPRNHKKWIATDLDISTY